MSSRNRFKLQQESLSHEAPEGEVNYSQFLFSDRYLQTFRKKKKKFKKIWNIQILYVNIYYCLYEA